MSVLEQIDAKVSQLSPELQAEVLDFVEFLNYKKAKDQPPTADPTPQLPNRRGAGKGIVTYIADDFDAPLDDLKDYM